MAEPGIEGCKMCGKCCRIFGSHVIQKTGDFDQDKLALFSGGIDLGYAIVFDHPCRYLGKDNLCAIHEDPNRPQCCKDFGPGENWYHPDGCAFVNTDHNSQDWKIRNLGRWKGQDG